MLHKLASEDEKVVESHNIPVFEVDARKKRDVSVMLEALLHSINSKQESVALINYLLVR